MAEKNKNYLKLLKKSRKLLELAGSLFHLFNYITYQCEAVINHVAKEK